MFCWTTKNTVYSIEYYFSPILKNNSILKYLKNTLRYVRAIRTMYIFSSVTLHCVRAMMKNNHLFREIFSNWISHDNYLISLLYSIIMDILDFKDFMDYIEFIEFIDYIKTRLYSWKYFSNWFNIHLRRRRN